LFICNDEEELEDIKEEVMEEFEDIVEGVLGSREEVGVYVQASTLGSLEALLAFLKQSKIPVFKANIGVVHKKDVVRCNLMRERGKPEYAVILAFDVKIADDAKKEAKRTGTQIFTADIIYHLFDKFSKYMAEVEEQKKKGMQNEAVFPCILRIIKENVFRKNDPIICGVDVLEGVLKIGTPLCVPDQNNLQIGRVMGIEKDKDKPLQEATKGMAVCIKIEPQ
ncbi:unnamed protein product, partial [marine sediment metagenome]